MSLFANISSATTQALTDSVAAVAETTQPVAQELSVWDLCLEGGFIMIPLLILSIMCIYIFVERAMAINKASQEDA